MLGIDITRTGVKLVELSKQDESYTLERYAIVPFEPKNQDNQQTHDEIHLVAQAIKRALKIAKTSRQHAAIALESALVITKLVPISAGFSEDDIMEQLLIEAPKYIPYNVHDIVFDFEIQGPNKLNVNNIDVLLVATRKETVEHKSAMVTASGLTPHIIDIDTFAVGNALQYLLSQQIPDIPNQTVAVIDIGENITTLHVIDHLNAIYTRSQEFGGRQLTHLIAQTYQLTYEDAEHAKKSGDLPDSYIHDILAPFKQTIVEQIQRSIQFFSASQNQHRIDCIILSGGCAAILDLDDVVSRALNLPTFIANPFVTMRYAPTIHPQHLHAHASSMLIACGLALRNFG